MANLLAATREAWAEAAVQAIDAARDELVAVSLDIHAHPELNYEERHAARVLSDALERRGFKVERGVGGVETAFRAEIGDASSGPTIAFLAEYDALPEIGHGCGHNLIAISNYGAGIGAMAALKDLPGRIVVLGTPAEEGGGGKIRMLDGGAFEGIDVSLSSHPASNRTIIPTDIPLDDSWALAMIGFRYAFHGKASHAAVAPENGINALDAVILFFNGINALRQQVRSDVRIHGVITDGGKAPNVIPEFAAANFMLRSADRVYLKDIVEKVRSIAEGAAAMTGARLEITPFYPNYENVRPNQVLARQVKANAEAVGMKIEAPANRRGPGASTDFGNVSQVMPSFALSFAVSETPVSAHTAAMTVVARTDLAQESAILTAKSLALTALDLLANPELLAAAKADYAARKV